VRRLLVQMQSSACGGALLPDGSHLVKTVGKV
jgi:hypothetical protein